MKARKKNDRFRAPPLNNKRAKAAGSIKQRHPLGRNGIRLQQRLQQQQQQQQQEQQQQQQQQKQQKQEQQHQQHQHKDRVKQREIKRLTTDTDSHSVATEQQQQKQQQKQQHKQHQQEPHKVKAKKRKHNHEHQQQQQEQKHHPDGEQQQQQQQKQQKHQQQQQQQLSRCVFVRNLPFDVNEEELSAALQQFGGLEKIYLIKNDRGECKGAAFAYFADAIAAQRAVAASAAFMQQKESLSTRQQKRVSRLLAAQHQQHQQQLLLHDDLQQQQQQQSAAACGASLVLKGRQFQVLPALSKEKAKDLLQSKQQERAAEGLRKRSLQLAFCGLPSKPFKVELDPQQQQQQQQQQETKKVKAKEWKAKAAAAITKVAIIREKREKTDNNKDTQNSPRRSLGFCFIDICTHFPQTLQLLHAIRDSKGFFTKPSEVLQQQQQQQQQQRRPIVQFALEDARKVKIREERIAAFAALLKGKETKERTEGGDKQKKTLKKKTYSRGMSK
ncbi:hypothetical protein, conserved [Eimeria acervulina]|uniref:RRM domain-containing protein n=1 Tax=Eimeria acervulina TaxID=5801 RepID=U6G9R1_EIMAC|nr:hypothetical protein, conserved [Eimeria acervulina]CDI76277.1 hypothetical protein, conserved [Eimeria acervulina]